MAEKKFGDKNHAKYKRKEHDKSVNPLSLSIKLIF